MLHLSLSLLGLALAAPTLQERVEALLPEGAATPESMLACSPAGPWIADRARGLQSPEQLAALEQLAASLPADAAMVMLRWGGSDGPRRVSLDVPPAMQAQALSALMPERQPAEEGRPEAEVGRMRVAGGLVLEERGEVPRGPGSQLWRKLEPQQQGCIASFAYTAQSPGNIARQVKEAAFYLPMLGEQRMVGVFRTHSPAPSGLQPVAPPLQGSSTRIPVALLSLSVPPSAFQYLLPSELAAKAKVGAILPAGITLALLESKPEPRYVVALPLPEGARGFSPARSTDRVMRMLEEQKIPAERTTRSSISVRLPQQELLVVARRRALYIGNDPIATAEAALGVGGPWYSEEALALAGEHAVTLHGRFPVAPGQPPSPLSLTLGVEGDLWTFSVLTTMSGVDLLRLFAEEGAKVPGT